MDKSEQVQYLSHYMIQSVLGGSANQDLTNWTSVGNYDIFQRQLSG